MRHGSYGCSSLTAGRLRIVAASVLVAACQKPAQEVVAYTSVDQVFSAPVFQAFESTTKIRVRGGFDTEETKSTGVLNRIIAEASHPQADVFWSGDPMRVFALIKRDLVEPYASPMAQRIPPELKAADGTWTGFAARARILLVNTDLLPAGERPSSIRDLANPRWKGRTAMASPLFGTTTMHIAALFASWGDDSARSFLNAVRANGAHIASSNGEVKRLVARGEVAFGLTDTDDANEAIKDGAPVAVVYPDQDAFGTLVMPTVVVLLKGAPHPAEGKRLVDYLLSATVEQHMADSAAHMPVGPGVKLSERTIGLSRLKVMQVDYARVAETMERIQPWLREWVGL
jgi:iron(III) transport system substrate-binding protein